MGKLSSNLVISLLDRTGAGTRSVLKNVTAIKAANVGMGAAIGQTTSALRRQTRTMRAFRTLGGGGAGIAGLGATAAAASFLRSELKFQEAMNRTRATLNVTSKKGFKPHFDLVVELSRKYPATAAEIAKGATELAQAGMSLARVNQVIEATVLGAMASGVSIKQVGQGVTDTVMGLGLSPTRKNFNRVNDILTAAATSYSQNYQGFLGGLAKTAPIARMVGMSLKELIGMLGILADSNFKAEKGGTAFRSSMINMAAPKKTAVGILAKQYQIDITKYAKAVDKFKLVGEHGARTLAGYVALELGQGVESEKLLEGILAPILSNPNAIKDIPKLRQKLGAAIASALNIKAGDVENRRVVGESINRFLQAGFKQFDVGKFLRVLAAKNFDSNVSGMKELFGKRFVAPMAAMMEAMRNGAYDEKYLNTFLPRVDNAAKRFAAILMSGYVGAIKRLGSAFDALMRSMANSGAIDVVSSAFGKLTEFINSLSRTSPAALKAITLAMLAIGTIAPVGFALHGLAAAVTVLGGVKGAAILATAAAVVYLYSRSKALRGLGVITLGVTAPGLLGAVAALKWLIANREGLKSAAAGFWEGFKSEAAVSLGIDLSNLERHLESVWNLLDRVTGKMSASNEQWRAFGNTLGGHVGTALRTIVNLFQQSKNAFIWLNNAIASTVAGRAAGFKKFDYIKWLGPGEKAGNAPGATSPAAAAAAASGRTAASAPSGAVAAKPRDLLQVKQSAVTAESQVRQSMTRIRAIIDGVDLTSSGRKIMTTLAAGMRQGMAEPIAAMATTAQRIKNHVPHSPAKEGPLRGLHRNGIMSEIARGIRSDHSAVRAMNAAAMRAQAAMNVRTQRSAGGGLATTGNSVTMGNVNVHVTIPQGVTEPDAIGAAIGREVRNSVREHYGDGGI